MVCRGFEVDSHTRFVPERVCLNIGLMESADLTQLFWVGNESRKNRAAEGL